jgi:RimJ/RimL family protein N-acetyltransferase
VGDVATNAELVTARLSLRRPVRGDTEAILKICGEPHPGVTTVPDLTAARRRYDEWDAHWDRYGYGYWVVRYLDNDAALGFCGIRSMNMPGGPALNLYYRLAEQAWGRGIATEAATAVVTWSRTHLPDLPVIARIQPDNTASPGVALRAGLSPAEHLDTDSWIHYATPADWGRS